MTVIAAGFDSGQLPYKKVDIRREPAAETRLPQPVAASARTGQSRPAEPAADFSTPQYSSPQNGAPATNGARTSALNLDEELDVPDFLK